MYSLGNNERVVTLLLKSMPISMPGTRVVDGGGDRVDGGGIRSRAGVETDEVDVQGEGVV